MDVITYEIGGIIYVNLTNRCSNDCTFCERTRVDNMSGYNLWLDREPTADEIIASLKSRDLSAVTDLVFCGWGEPTYRMAEIIKVAKFAHDMRLATRINTNGQGSLIAGYDISSEVASVIDSVSISLNCSNSVDYQKSCVSEFGEKAFEELLNFAEKCSNKGVSVTLSVVDFIGKNQVEECRAIAKSIGVNFKVRPEIK